MQIVALVSGGKDSTMNMLKCVEAGHQIVCLLNLFPPFSNSNNDPGSDEKRELDSYMYQSVGSEAIEEFARCMQLPLIRCPIRGRPQDLSYDYTNAEEHAGDEVEDLYDALRQVLERFPEVKGVSSGAIWSSYQKNRVEQVCDRFGLTSLAYLWEREQVGLLQEMIDSRITAILIKVAAAGLTRDDLGKTLQEAQPRLVALKERYGINVCGEGGEFESLTLDCPLFAKERLEVVDARVVIHRDDMFAPVAYLVLSVRRVPK